MSRPFWPTEHPRHLLRPANLPSWNYWRCVPWVWAHAFPQMMHSHPLPGKFSSPEAIHLRNVVLSPCFRFLSKPVKISKPSQIIPPPGTLFGWPKPTRGGTLFGKIFRNFGCGILTTDASCLCWPSLKARDGASFLEMRNLVVSFPFSIRTW